jgi:SAM-dependent methyltransferase
MQGVRCPVCGYARCQVADRLSGKELRTLWRALGREFSPAAWGSIDENYVVVLTRCEACGFRFFDPALAGNETFYRELEHQGYFSPTRPEFERTLRFAAKRDILCVLDVGCGSGDFLDLARRAGYKTSGLELNRAAAEKARLRGHCIYERLLHELDPSEINGGFDLITMFQVLEHVRDPVALVKDAKAHLNRRGFISLAVPSEHGLCRLTSLDPHQWPPHHVTRWRLADLEQLARATQTRLLKSGGDPLLGSDIPRVMAARAKLAEALGEKAGDGGKSLGLLISFLYRKTGMKFLFPNWGSSIYAYLACE